MTISRTSIVTSDQVAPTIIIPTGWPQRFERNEVKLFIFHCGEQL